jgi:signal transduction histidine kinase
MVLSDACGADTLARRQAIALHHFYEGALKGHGAVRAATLVSTLVVIGMVVDGVVFWGSLICLAIAGAFDWRVYRTFYRDWALDDRDPKRSPAAKVRQLERAMACMVAAYSAPFVMLAFAPMPGPIIGILFSCGAFLVICGQHTVTRAMVRYTLPGPALALLSCLHALQGGPFAWALLLLGVALIANVYNLTRASTIASEALIRAQIGAEEGAERLEERVKLRTAELEDAKRAAEGASIAKSQFLASMSHELRTPLNAIIGYSEILREGAESETRSEDVADLDRVHGAAKHLLQLITEILNFSKIEAGRESLHLEVVDASARAREATDMIRPAMTANQNTFVVEIAELGMVQTDAFKLTQCLLNLLSNAAKFTRGGVVTLRAHRVLAPAGEILEFRIADTGIGIETEKLGALFEPFVQADASTTRRFGGTGLGLAITRRLARLLGGDVTVESHVGKGSEFSLHIPATPAVCALEAAA